MTAKYSMTDVLTLMSCLRHPQKGCNWDLKQTLQSLTSHTLEEVYEVVDAVEQGSADQLCDELGDLLFQIVFYAQISSEQNSFDFEDVCHAIVTKLLRRHPHIFPDGTLQSFGSSERDGISAEQVAANWEQIKIRERADKAASTDASHGLSVLDDVPSALPAMNRAGKLQKRAASVGFDWQELTPVLEKLEEEIAELRAEIAAGNQQRIAEDFGDVLFSCVNLSRHLAVEPEASLRAANTRFETRFRELEKRAVAAGQRAADMSAEQLNQLWDEVKSVEGNPVG